MTNYQVKELDIDKIKVDQKNPRFRVVSSQKEAINMMLENQGKNIIALADHISKHGLNPTMRVIVFKENGDYVSGDGNRRVTVLKCMHNPGLVNDAQLKKSLAKFAKASFPNKVACVVFENRDDARIWISLNHNGVGKGEGSIPWGSAERDRFNQTESIGTQIMDKYVQNNDLSRYNKTTMDRFFKFVVIKKNLIIELDAKGAIDFSKIDDAKTKALVQGLADTPVDDVYSVKKAKAFYAQHIAASASPKRKARATTQTRKSVMSEDFTLTITDTKANNVFDELQRIDVEKFPIASAILLRAFLELTADYYCKKANIPIPEKMSLMGKFKKSYQHMNLSGNEKTTLDAITNKNHPAHTNILNSYTHNPTHIPDWISVKTAFDNLSVFFRHAYS